MIQCTTAVSWKVADSFTMGRQTVTETSKRSCQVRAEKGWTCSRVENRRGRKWSGLNSPARGEVGGLCSAYANAHCWGLEIAGK